MEFREFDKLGIAPSLLGYGCMRFPIREDKSIDEQEATALLDRAIAGGVTYIDTAYPYHDQQSEAFVGKALEKYDRSSYYLATKLPVWLVEKPEDVRKLFEEQCEKLKTDYIDFYLLHSLNKDRWDKVKEHRMVEILEELKAEGRIKYLGFSFHDEYPVFDKILRDREWDFCQIQLNYVDTNIQQGIKGYELAEKLNIPIVIMEPVKGGALAKLPDEMSQIFTNLAPNQSIASWAFRYIASLPNVKVVLSGMSTMDQVEDNLKTYGEFQPLSQEEQEAVKKVTEIYRSRQQNDCTGCNYCMPCPYDVNIPGNFKIWNNSAIYEDEKGGREDYFKLEEKNRATACQACGACEPQCPQNISIIEDLKKVASQFE